MKAEDFDTLALEILDHCKTTLVGKGEEYSRGGDRLHNFKVAARRRGIAPIEALRGMKLKHEVSIDDICDDAVQRGKFASKAMILEKIGDDINYNLLLAALLLEQEVATDRLDSEFKVSLAQALTRAGEEALKNMEAAQDLAQEKVYEAVKGVQKDKDVSESDIAREFEQWLSSFGAPLAQDAFERTASRFGLPSEYKHTDIELQWQAYRAGYLS